MKGRNSQSPVILFQCLSIHTVSEISNGQLFKIFAFFHFWIQKHPVPYKPKQSLLPIFQCLSLGIISKTSNKTSKVTPFTPLKIYPILSIKSNKQIQKESKKVNFGSKIKIWGPNKTHLPHFRHKSFPEICNTVVFTHSSMPLMRYI